MSEKLTQLQKEEILNNVFKDQTALLRQFIADDMVKQGTAKTFREAVEMIRIQEIAEENLSALKNTTLSGQELDLKSFMNSKDL